MNRSLASDKYVDGTHAGHPGGMNVLNTDSSIQWVTVDELPMPTMLPEGLVR